MKKVLLACCLAVAMLTFAKTEPFANLEEKGGKMVVKATGLPFTGIAEEYFKNGKSVKLKVDYKNGLVDGATRTFYEFNGKPQEEFVSKAGKRDGMLKRYYISGKIQSKEQYKGGALHGEAIEYYENGNVKSEGKYVNGKLDGDFKEYDENKQIRVKTTWKNGVKTATKEY
ncbi:MAG: toxin-antitoxin system YwqK family antitoxin [Fusobacteriaceae bacterium]|jgi:antitoxin component YwqK of YwqJK toxin-antitoxin module|nr:toxin-antitoxin system YwqK family antitoxin [Fusobacteriaceae bacterium]